VRTHRSRSALPDSEHKTLLGKGQYRLLLDWLANSRATFKFIVSPVPFNSRLNLTDGWTGYLYERESILDFIESQNIGGTIFISGDCHFSFFTKLRNWAYEFSISPIQALPFVGGSYFYPPSTVVRHPREDRIIEDKTTWFHDASYINSYEYARCVIFLVFFLSFFFFFILTVRNAAVFLYGSWEVDTTPLDINLHTATLSVYGNIFFAPSVLKSITLDYAATVPHRTQKRMEETRDLNQEKNSLTSEL
jgi:hypothetical protein